MTNRPVSPLKSAIEELECLRARFRETVDVFASRVEGEILRVTESVEHQLGRKRAPSGKQLADVRDMLHLLRNLEVKPRKGRRRDLKKFEVLTEDLAHLTEGWD